MKKQTMKKQNKKEPKKIGGVLYLVLAWLAIFIIQSMSDVFRILSESMNDPIYLIFIISNIIFSILATLIFVLIIKKKKAGIPTMIVLLVGNFLIFLITDIIIEDYFSLVISFMFFTLFVVYFLISKRVKETLVN